MQHAGEVNSKLSAYSHAGVNGTGRDKCLLETTASVCHRTITLLYLICAYSVSKHMVGVVVVVAVAVVVVVVLSSPSSLSFLVLYDHKNDQAY